jgi:hypothetical protein
MLNKRRGLIGVGEQIEICGIKTMIWSVFVTGGRKKDLTNFAQAKSCRQFHHRKISVWAI